MIAHRFYLWVTSGFAREMRDHAGHPVGAVSGALDDD
jgi:hypothetical protein